MANRVLKKNRQMLINAYYDGARRRTLREVAKILDVHHSTVVVWLKQYGLYESGRK